MTSTDVDGESTSHQSGSDSSISEKDEPTQNEPKTPISLVFFGSGPVAAKSLELLSKSFEIEAVITKPKPDHHRGVFPVLELTEKNSLRTLTPQNKSELSQLFTTKPVSSRIGVVIDYGIIIPQEVIDYFPLGIINSHFSLLPQWRGADPITFSVLSGQEKTGVSLMLIAAGLDEGPLLAQRSYELPPAITTPELTEALIQLSDSALKEFLPLYVNGDIVPMPQEEATISPSKNPTYSRKLSKQDGIIDWTKPAIQIEREIRAYQGWPGSKTNLAGKEVTVTKAKILKSTKNNKKPGTVLVEDYSLMVATSDGLLLIESLKPAGKKEMSAREFIIGHKNRLINQ
jgi:methionyl-tRNA formyltransferase